MIGCIVEDRYLVEQELGTGAMGRVYAARHVKVGRRVAIKVMHEELAKNPAIVERFAREAMVAARLRHPNLVAVLDVGTAPDGRPLIVLELAPGAPLSEIAYAGDTLPASRIVNLIDQLLRGLEHAHRAGLIHRDLKPDNVLVETTAEGHEIPRIVDFGIAILAQPDTTVAGRRLTEANMVIGTPFYMSPEQARAKDVDHRSDLFSLGVIMYELLAGMPPFPGTSVDVALANATREAPSIAERAGIDVDPLLEAFVRKLIERRVEQRFQSAREALDMLALIRRDRIGAARVFAGASMHDLPPALEAPPLIQRVACTNSDAMTTITEPVAEPQDPTDDDATDDDFSDLEYSPRTIMRRRKRFAIGLATAAMALLAAAGFAARQPDVFAETPMFDVTSSSEVVVDARTTLVTVLPAPLSPLPASKTRIARGVNHKPVVVPVVVAATPQRAPQPSEVPAAIEVKLDDHGAALVASKYAGIAKALKHCASGPETDALWARFRLIRYNEAIATESSRREALLALGSIESSIR